MSRRLSFLIVTILAALLAAPAFGFSEGPPWLQNDRIVPEEGCSCHGAGGSPSSEVTISISSVPRTYSVGSTYNMTIDLVHPSYNLGGFMLWDYGAGSFSEGDGIAFVEDSGGAISHNVEGNGWLVTWTAPAEDVGNIHFSLAGNIVDGSGNADEGDHWNTLSFTISAPGTVTDDAEPSLRTISVGDYEDLFGQKSAEEIEAERQAELAAKYFDQGNLYFWTTLSILIIGAVIQGEFYERRFAGGPPNLDMSLAIPQGIFRGVISIAMVIFLGWSVDVALPWGYILVIGMCTLWSIFGVYRTVVQARAPKLATDLV